MFIVINGGGKIGETLAVMMIKQGHQVAIIEIDPQNANRLAMNLPNSALVIEGDGCDPEVLKDANTDRADVFVAATGHDDDNLVACELARIVCDIPRCIARVNNPKNERIFRRVGIEALSVTTVIANMIEEEATHWQTS